MGFAVAKCVVASKCSRNNFISEKYKTVQLFKLHFLQNIPRVQLYISASGSKGVGNIAGSHFLKAFSALSSHS
jgi:outer membrane lipoprotein SlyB